MATGLFLCPVLFGQQASEPQRKYSRFSEPDVKQEKTVTIDSEMTSRIEIPGIEIVPCQARVELAYSQRNDVARVDATITHRQCPTVTGTFDVLVSVRSGDDDLTRYTYPETFSLDGNETTSFRREYPIGTNVSLGSVRSRNVQCECLGPPAE